MTKANDATYYDGMMKGWDVAKLGPKPTPAQLATIHGLGARPGKQALANAMALRPKGVTGSQIVIATGAPQLNKMRGFVTDGLAKFEPMPFSPEGHKVYKLNLTPKGVTKAKTGQAELAAKAAAKPAKAAKPRKPKAVKPEAPATSEAPANEANATA